VLSDSAGMLSGITDEDREEKRKMFEASAQIAEKYGREKLADVTLSLMFSDEFIKNQPDVIKLVRERIVKSSGVGYARTIKGVLSDYWEASMDDFKQRLANIKATTLILAGDVDKLTPLPTQQAIHRAIPGSRLEVITGSGHIPPVEQPDLWNKLVLEFLESVEV